MDERFQDRAGSAALVDGGPIGFMAEAGKDKRFYWLKLPEGWFDQDSIKIIMAKPDGALYIAILQQLYLKSMNKNGQLPYDEEELCALTSAPGLAVFQKAISLFQKHELISISGGYIFFHEVPGMVGSETRWAQYQRASRSKNKGLTMSNAESGDLTMSNTGKPSDLTMSNEKSGDLTMSNWDLTMSNTGKPSDLTMSNEKSGDLTMSNWDLTMSNEKTGKTGVLFDMNLTLSNKRKEILAGTTDREERISAANVERDARARMREADPSKSEGIKHYRRWIGFPTSAELDELVSFLDAGMEDGVIYEAVEDAHSHGKCTHAYVVSILERCMQQSILTRQSYIAEREAFKKARKEPRKTPIDNELEARHKARMENPGTVARVMEKLGLARRGDGK